MLYFYQLRLCSTADIAHKATCASKTGHNFVEQLCRNRCLANPAHAPKNQNADHFLFLHNMNIAPLQVEKRKSKDTHCMSFKI